MQPNDDVICIICARGGSKGLPRKNIRLLGGEPLIARPVLVTTEDEEIAGAARAAGAVVPFLRPADLAQDLTTTEDTLKHALLTYEQMIDRKFAIAVFLTATDVFRDPAWIREAVETLRRRPELESVFSGHKTNKNYWEKQDDGTWIRVKPWMSVYSSRQVRRAVVREASRAQLWREGRRIGDRVEIIVNDDAFTGIDIHADDDLQLAEAALQIRGRERGRT